MGAVMEQRVVNGASANGAGPRRGGAVVTGAARGLGLEIARGLGRAGFAVHLTDADEGAVQEAAQSVEGPSFASALDVTDAEGCRAVAAATADRAGSLVLWVNNAGILRTRPVWEHSAAEREAVIAVNLHGVMNGTHAALDVMRPAGHGHILNVVSLAGVVVSPGQVLYAASKHAALAFSLGTQLDLRVAGLNDIHVSALCPHGVWTPMLHGLTDDPSAAASWAGGSLLSPGEVATAALGLVERPRPVLTVPRSQWAFLRAYASFPRLMVAVAPRVMASARRKQRQFRERV